MLIFFTHIFVILVVYLSLIRIESSWLLVLITITWLLLWRRVNTILYLTVIYIDIVALIALFTIVNHSPFFCLHT